MPRDELSSEEKLEVDVPTNDNQVVNPEDSIATTKEEEWVTKKKIELTTTRQIETRVKRQVVLEDGKIVEDSGPMVTTNTTEDTEKQEHSQTERRTLGDDNACDNWEVAPISAGRGKEVQEKTVKSREEKEERTETENVQHLGDISDEGYMTAVKSGSNDVRQMLAITGGKNLVETLPKIVHQSMKIKKCIDTEDKREVNKIQPGGKIISEKKITTLHEELADYNISDDDSSKSPSVYETTKKGNSQKYRKTKEQDLTEYLANGQKIAEQLHYEIDTSEGEKHGDDLKFNDEENISSRLKRIQMRSQNNRPFFENKQDKFGQILPKKSLALDQEEETRKEETSKWLEHHFGSESTKSSRDSAENLEDIIPSTQNSFINVTMKSQLLKKNQNPKPEENSKKFKILDRKNGRNFTNNEKMNSFSSSKTDSFQGINHWASRRDEDKSDSDSKFHSDQNLPSFKISSHDLIPSRNHLKAGNVLINTSLNQTEDDDERLEFVVDAEEKQRRTKNSKPYDPVSSIRSDSRDCFCCDNEPGPAFSRQSKRDASSNEECEKKMQNTEWEAKPDKLRVSTPREMDAPSSKKIYQRTRFAADIPPPPPPQTKQAPVKQKSKIGESFRKLVGKLRSSSTDRKNKKKLKGGESRSPSPKENTYQHYNSLDNYDSVVNRCSETPEEPVSSSKIRHGYSQPRLNGEDDKLVQRYYLGEDPFSKSIYGREKEYKENFSPRKNTESLEGDEIDENDDSDYKSRTLGRFSKSTSRLQHSEIRPNISIKDRGGVQTLPRKFRDEKMIGDQRVNEKKLSKESFSRGPKNWENSGTSLNSKEPMSHAHSLINVSFVNQPSSLAYVSDVRNNAEYPWQGPAKPARTYRSNLSRSKSFNVQPGLGTTLDLQKSSPHLQGLEESPPPLESPSMIFQWSQSSNCLNEKKFDSSRVQDSRNFLSKGPHNRTLKNSANFIHDDVSNEFQKINSNSQVAGSKRNQEVDYSSSFRSSSTINTHDSTNSSLVDVSEYNHLKPSYLKNSYPPVYIKTFRDGNVIKTVSRSENSTNDDFSETVRIESKSEDPYNPTETNTVKIFSKKRVPSKNGLALETIESQETKTVVTRQGLRDDVDNRRILYNSSPSGVVIKVRNGKTESKHL